MMFIFVACCQYSLVEKNRKRTSGAQAATGTRNDLHNLRCIITEACDH